MFARFAKIADERKKFGDSKYASIFMSTCMPDEFIQELADGFNYGRLHIEQLKEKLSKENRVHEVSSNSQKLEKHLFEWADLGLKIYSEMLGLERILFASTKVESDGAKTKEVKGGNKK